MDLSSGYCSQVELSHRPLFPGDTFGGGGLNLEVASVGYGGEGKWLLPVLSLSDKIGKAETVKQWLSLGAAKFRRVMDEFCESKKG